ncbi:long-chain acyl-CoA synthetase [Tremella mesenterica]|uniref:Long-chain acyl-CoA synthetase n=1 Tax=Tremella mesenterica TaxID=5217 RepID=A0A4Q1BWT5_TREME|nr:long-chain acyl-CoA synthetase [Tremella mesenterica]
MPITPYPPHTSLTSQSVEIPSSRKAGQTGVFKNAIWDKSRLTEKDEPRTLFELFEQSVARHPHRSLFLRRDTIPPSASSTTDEVTFGTTLLSTTYSQVQQRRTALGSALLALERDGRLKAPNVGSITPVELTHPGVPHFSTSNRLKHGARRGWAVGMWSKNREEWQVIDLACQAYGLVSVSLYETLGPDVAKYITNHCPLSIVFAARNHLPSLLKVVPQCSTLKVIVSMDPLPRTEGEVLKQWAKSVNVELLDMVELEKWGMTEGVFCEPGPVKGVHGEEELDRQRIVTISYTSGTTGDPKGVVLTNDNVTTAVVSNALGATEQLNHQEWRFLSYMPLSHIYERFLELLVMYANGTIGLTTGDTTRLLEDAQLIKPHFMAGVPRVWNRINAAVQTQIEAGGLKGALLSKAVEAKLANWRQNAEVKHTLYDILVFRKIRNLLGGNILYIGSGAAPLAAEVHELLKICFSCEVVQGVSPPLLYCLIPWDIKSVGTCGQIQPCNDVKLVDVPDMGYRSTDKPSPRGEICLKGCNITPGYLHDPINTTKLIDKDGWMHTEDIGEIDSDGRLKIIDRIKNVVKLSQGEYVALEKLEGIYALNPLFATLLVHGDSTRSCIVAIAVLDPAQAANLAHHVLGQTFHPEDVKTLERVVQDKKVKRAVLEGLVKIAKSHRLNGFETIKGVHLTLTPFPDDLITPTLKVKRSVAAKWFKKEIDQAYRDSEEGTGIQKAKL